MPKNNFGGGSSIFPTTLRPSLFNPLPASELLARKGEKFIWLRAMPTPNISGGKLALPDKDKGYIYTFEKYLNIPEEAILSTVTGATEVNVVYVRYSPVAKVNRVWIPRDPVVGPVEDFKVKNIVGNRVELEWGELKYWDNVNINYDILLYDTLSLEQTLETDTNFIELAKDSKVLIKVTNFWYRMPGEEKFIGLDGLKNDYFKAYFHRVLPRGTEIKMLYDLYTPLDVAYKTISLKEIEEAKLPVGAQEGDLEIIVSESAKLSKGDILISTLSYAVEKEIAVFEPGKGYALKRNPVVEILQVFSSDKEYQRGSFEFAMCHFVK